MIHYQLQCDRAHAFDGWFNDSTSFDRQAEMGLVTCPFCNSTDVKRALMAPALGHGSRHAKDIAVPMDPASSPASGRAPAAVPAVAPSPRGALAEAEGLDKLRSLLHHLRVEVEKHCDYVGPGFAEEARRIHYGEADARGIYGEATAAETEALADEGIEFGVMPWLRRSDS
jgi:hypothetical protein